MRVYFDYNATTPVTADVIERMRADLSRLLNEFENANANSDSVADSVGHTHLADKVRNWGFPLDWPLRPGDTVTVEERIF